MTSKISSYIKLIRSDIRHRGWLAALSCILFFLLMPVYTILYLSTYTDRTSDLILYFPGLLNGGTQSYLAAAIAVLAVLSALSGFSYIHSKEKTDFFHSLPVKRTVWFGTTYLSGLLIVLIPYVVCCILTIAAGAVSKGMTVALIGRSTEAAIGGLLAFLVLYNASVLAVMLTGRTVTGLLASMAVIVYPFLMLMLISAMENAFYSTFYNESTPLPEKLARYLSPLGLFSALIDQSSSGMLGFAFPAAAILMSVLFIAAAVLIYRIYPSEASGTAIAFPVIAPVIKVLICIPSALFVSLVIQDLMMLDGNKWLPLLSLLAAVIICAVIDFIYTMDLRLLIKSWKSSLLSIIGVLAVLCFFQFDVIGYDTYIPDEEDIESISFCPDTFLNYFTYPESEHGTDPSSGYFAPEDMTAALYTLAQSGIDNLKNGLTPKNVYDTDDIPQALLSSYPEAENDDSDDIGTDESCFSALFRYKLSNGRVINRQYALRYSDTVDVLRELLESREYRERIFPIFEIDKDTVSTIALSDIYKTAEELKLDKEQKKALLDAYETDVLNASADTFIDSNPLGELEVSFLNPLLAEYGTVTDDGMITYDTTGFSYYGDGNSFVPQLYIYPEYTNTLALLEEYGYTLHTEINPEDVSSITLYPAGSTEEVSRCDELIPRLSDTAVVYYDELSSEMTISVTGQNDIKILLSYLDHYAGGILDDGSVYPDYMEIQFKNGNLNGYSLKIQL